MTQEEKELVLKDLCARLTYGVIVDYKEDKYDFHHWKISTLHAPAYSQSGNLISTDSDGWIEYNEYKGCGMSSGSRPLHLEITLPFLRPMSSLTEEENEWLNDRINFSRDDEVDKVRQKWGIVMQEIYTNSSKYVFSNFTEILDWLNEHHFDYRGLIEKGLALEAPEGMYK